MKKKVHKNRSSIVFQSKKSGSSLYSPLGVRVHFVGIGGIGMCGLAELLHRSGSLVTGSDLSENPQIKRLKSLSIPIWIGHKKENIGRAEIVVQSSAVPKNNVEIQFAKANKVPVISRSSALAEVMRLKRGLVVAGTHGKTTTTHLLSLIFMHNQKDPTVVIGGRSHLFQSTSFLGKGKWFIAESDESDGGFKHLSPEIALITNMDYDHVDYYGSFEKLKKAFLVFALKTPFYGAVVACGDDPALRGMLSSIKRKVVFYGFKPHNHFMLKKIQERKYKVFLNITKKPELSMPFKMESQKTIKSTSQSIRKTYKTEIGTLNVPLYGAMNALNTLSAVVGAMITGLSFKECVRSFKHFKGLDRRFQKKGIAKGIEFYDDYAHHPTEIQALLSAFREKFGWRKRLVVLFQPHRFSRTKACWPDFLTCFKLANAVFLMDIYPAGEKPLKGISSKKLAQAINSPPAFYYEPEKMKTRVVTDLKKKTPPLNSDPSCLFQKLSTFLKKGDVFITMGAGSVYKEGEKIMLFFKQ